VRLKTLRNARDGLLDRERDRNGGGGESAALVECNETFSMSSTGTDSSMNTRCSKYAICVSNDTILL
jgi:hypothetical protein